MTTIQEDIDAICADIEVVFESLIRRSYGPGLTRGNRRWMCYARMNVWWCLYPKWSLPSIARAFRVSHSSVLMAIRKVNEDLAGDAA
jgi:hypothetical protein